jgi:hypothetical protein
VPLGGKRDWMRSISTSVLLNEPLNWTQTLLSIAACLVGWTQVEEATPEADRVFEALEKPGHTTQEPIPTKRIEMAAEGTCA